ncbi:tetratricopeptide repeat protein [Bowmanella denitrificans]|uniref:tetratricopeptide repeat protein n=1 Tax=Bowmanella denitrificans TaxID=366582 RepID=UPI000C99D351|nr:tetratricopeptide repeat protein [Bowmanella denitrificans]
MQDKIQKARELVAEGRFKKALSIVKKINQKSQLTSFESLELEARCLYQEGNYQLALLKTEAALKLADSAEKRYSCLENMASVHQQLGNRHAAIECIKEVLNATQALERAQLRFGLISLAAEVKDYNTIECYAPALSNVEEYTTDATLYLAEAAINDKNIDKACSYLDKVTVDICTQIRQSIKQQQIVNTLNGYHHIHAFKKESDLLENLRDRFQHEKWFNAVEMRLRDVGARDNSSINVEYKKGNISQEKSAIKPGVIGNDINIVNAVTKLRSELEKNGAFFHRDLRFVVEGNDISVQMATASNITEKCMGVPLTCMPLVDDYQFSLDDDGKLIVETKKQMLNPQAKKLMQLLVNMYNACDKLANWREYFTLFSLAGFKPLFDKLISARSDSAIYLQYYADKKELISGYAVIKTFVGSRIFTLAQHELRKIGVKSSKGDEAVFIPIIELFNHRMGVSGFVKDAKNLDLVTYSQPGDEGREIFVQYNLDDPLITLLVYGFVDLSASWVYTVPIIIQTRSGLNMRIDNLCSSSPVEDVPNHLMGFSAYYPPKVIRHGKSVYVSKLVLPGKEHHSSLRMIITEVLKQIDIEGIYTNSDTMTAELNHIETMILGLNRQYWQELQNMVNEYVSKYSNFSLKTADVLLQLCDTYIKHIARYEAQSGRLLKQ